MATRNQNKAPKSPSNKIGAGAEIPFDKRRRLGGGRMAGPVSSGRTRQVFSSINSNQEHSRPASSAGTAPPDTVENVEFTKEEVEALLNKKIKGKQFDLKGKLEQLTTSNNQLRLCIKWFQGVEQNLNQEQEKLRSNVEAAEHKCREIDAERIKREEELEAVVQELRQNIINLEAKLKSEESEKMDAVKRYEREHEAKLAADEVNDSLAKELKKVEEEKIQSEQKRSHIEELYQRAQIYNTSLQQFSTKLQADLQKANDSLQKVEEDKSAAVDALGELRLQYKSLMEQIASSRASLEDALKKKEQLEDETRVLRGEVQSLREERDRQVTIVQGLRNDIDKYEEITEKSVKEVDEFTQKTKALEDICASQTKQLDILQCQLSAANERLKMADMSQSETLVQFDEQKRLISDLKDRLAEAEQQISEGEKLRKKLHNTILELKGNIRVFCRVRPLLPEESSNVETQAISYPTSTEARERGIDLLQNGQKYPFQFDKVFHHDASQNDVFVEISQLVQSALDGYKVCIFAYGQTGSGKTYTMMGRPEHSDQKGLIPRSLEQIFQASQNLSSQGWKYKMQASVLEIYNETIRDLLSTNRSISETSRGENNVTEKKYAIKHDANGNTIVSDLTVVDVSSSREVSSLLHQAAQSRSVGKTHMNEHSSRSHFVFTLRISGVNETTDQQVQGVLNLIDLAGSERLSKSGATGDRLKETQAINKSLSSLADVIFALAKKEDHVPFRNSKLTFLLQPCLGGDSKTLMFVNVSPEPSSVSESLCSLRFASRVNACEIGVPRRQTSMRSSDSRLSYG